MKYLLDVNALIAWEHSGQASTHGRFHAWAKKIGPSNLRTCAMSELGFLRISMQVFNYTLEEAGGALMDIKSRVGGFIESAPSPELDDWATTAAKTSDAYLMLIAKREGLHLATFDAGIPGAHLIK